MSMTATDKPRHCGINWVCVQKYFLLTMAFFAVYAAGGWTVSIRMQEASLPYLQRSTSQLEVIHKDVGLDPVKEIRCDRQVAAAVAKALVTNTAGQPVAALPVKVCPPPKLVPGAKPH